MLADVSILLKLFVDCIRVAKTGTGVNVSCGLRANVDVRNILGALFTLDEIGIYKRKLWVLSEGCECHRRSSLRRFWYLRLISELAAGRAGGGQSGVRGMENRPERDGELEGERHGRH